jgi:cobalt-zinc-cadmium efflux system membrane fusion protein
MKSFQFRSIKFSVAVLAVFSLAGCSQQTSGPDTSQTAAISHDGHDHEDAEPIHGGWWCYEHAVPEEQCAMCDSKLAATLRDKGDWCEEHIRPDSLCFECNPKNAEKFVALFEAKYGKKPPKPGDHE